MQALTETGQKTVAAIADRHGVSTDAARQLLSSLAAGGGRQAQFNHYELGGMGQWSQGGMIMIGDMFNQGLKSRVAALCDELAQALQGSSPLANAGAQAQSPPHEPGSASSFTQGAPSRWPAELGKPA